MSVWGVKGLRQPEVRRAATPRRTHSRLSERFSSGVDQRDGSSFGARLLDRLAERTEDRLQTGAADAGKRQHLRAGANGAQQRPALLLDLRRVERIDLVEPDDLRLVGKAMAIIGQFAADQAVGLDYIFLGAVDQVEDHGA